jgi:GntR family transcriptional regulator, transcriptional repressor for pyruvate dehydrogenase complex
MDLVQTPRTTVASLSTASSGDAVRPRRARGLVQEVVENLAASIREGVIQPGSKLPTESEIMARFDVSRTVVREAISNLQALNLVETRHGVGTFALMPRVHETFQVGAVDFALVADVIALLELRISLETEAAGLAAQRRTDAHLRTMRQLLDAFTAAIFEESDAVPSDFNFHLEIANATGNRHFSELMAYLGTMIIPRTRINTASAAPEGRQAYLTRVQIEHESIFVAISNQDAEAARAAMRTHLTSSLHRLRMAQSVQASATARPKT